MKSPKVGLKVNSQNGNYLIIMAQVKIVLFDIDVDIQEHIQRIFMYIKKGHTVMSAEDKVFHLHMKLEMWLMKYV